MDSKLTKSVSSKQSAVKLGIFIVMIAAMLITIASTPALADITRGCGGGFSIAVVSGSGVDSSKLTYKRFDSFEARGACKNITQANDCRRVLKTMSFVAQPTSGIFAGI